MLSFSFTFVQGMIQAFLWSGDQSTSSVVSSILDKANVSTAFLPWLTIEHNNYNLKVCSVAPYGVEDIDTICTTAFDSGTNYPQSALGARRDVGVAIGGFGAGDDSLQLGRRGVQVNGRAVSDHCWPWWNQLTSQAGTSGHS